MLGTGCQPCGVLSLQVPACLLPLCEMDIDIDLGDLVDLEQQLVWFI
jgi:hypothetical protein